MIPNSFFLVPMLLLVILLEPVVAAELKPDQCGLASVYSTDSENTASGEDTQPRNLTAAHRSLPFGDSCPRRHSRKRAFGGCTDHGSGSVRQRKNN